METDGNTIFDAVRNAVAISERKLYFSNCKVLIISKEIAQQGISPIFDWVIRDQEPRMTLIPLISKEDSASVLLKQEGVTNTLIGIEIWRTISNNETSLSEAANVPIFQAIDLLGGEGDSMILAAVKSTAVNDSESPELDGSAVFQKDKLVGFFDRDESKFFLFIRNQVKGGLLVFSPENDGRNVTLELQNCKSQIIPVISEEGASILIKLDVHAALAENETTDSLQADGQLKKAEKNAEKYLKAGMEQVIKKAQTQYDSDIFGFGAKIHQTDPEYWKTVKSQWPQQFKKLKCTEQITVTIDNSATAKDKIKVSD